MKNLVIITTYKCNMNCPFCLFYSDLHKNISINLNLFKKILKEAKYLAYEHISLTGGEPCLHPKFNELIKSIIEEDFTFNIASNGLQYVKYAKLLKNYRKYFKFITFSLESSYENLQNKLRKNSSYKEVIKAIEYFVKENLEVKVSICINKLNFNEIEEFVDFCEKLGVNEIRFLSVIPTNKNKYLVLSDKEKRECLGKILLLRKKAKIKLSFFSSLYAGEGINFCPALDDLSGLAVNPKGELLFCCDIYGKGAILGSLKRNKLFNLIKKGYKISNYLKEKRKEHLYTRIFFEGFNTCYFCNKYLKK